MTPSESAPTPVGTAAESPRTGATGAVTVRYWAAARAATGVDSDRHPGDTVGAVIDAAVARHPDLARVARVATFLVDGRKAGRDAVVGPNSTVEVLPPFAGG